MNKELVPDNNENELFTLKNEEIDYKKLITRLKDISSTIALLEKKYLDKF